jgi:thioredoxin 1
MPVRSLGVREFATHVLEAKEPVLVLFRAAWCAPSLQLAPIIEEISDAYSTRARVVTIDVGSDLAEMRANSICSHYKVTRVPVVMLFNEGRVKDFIGGMTSREAVTGMLERQLQPVLEVRAVDFETDVVQSKLPVLVHFHAAWCAASVDLLPVVEAAARQVQGRAKVAQVEFGPETAGLCARYGVQRVPVLAMFQGGEIKDQILGPMLGGTKIGERQTSCVGLTSSENLLHMVEQFAF